LFSRKSDKVIRMSPYCLGRFTILIPLPSRPAIFFLALISWLSVPGSAQQLPVGPMGLLQAPQPALKVPKALRAVLPHEAQVRLLQTSQLNPADTFVVYESLVHPIFPFFPLEYPTVAVLRGKRTIARFQIRKPFTVDADWVFLSGSEVRLSPKRSAAVFTFRALGDGCGNFFLALSANHGKYEIAMSRIAAQASLKVLDKNGTLELWEATFGDECIWCRHRYKISKYRWTGTAFVRTGSRRSRGKLDPSIVAAKPLVIPQTPATNSQHVAGLN
jgi:hypothetical protein